MAADGLKGRSVGYGNPPRHSRFQKGRSGNPRGRPKGSRNFATLLARALFERVKITENGKRRSISKLEASFKQLVNRAASGNLAAMRQLYALIPLLMGQPNDAESWRPDSDEDARENVLRQIEQVAQRMRGEEEPDTR